MQLLLLSQKENPDYKSTNLQLVNDLSISYQESEYDLKTEKIEHRKECARKELRSFFGEKESIDSVEFGITNANSGSVEKNTPVARVITNRANYLVIYDNLKLVKGNILDHSIKIGNYVEKRKMLGNPLVMVFLEEFAKGIIKSAGQEVFSMFFPKENDRVIKEEIQNLKEDIKEFLKEIKYENLEDTLIATRVWLRETYSNYIDNFSKNQSFNIEELRSDLKKRQEDLQNIESIIEARISDTDLNNCDYLTRSKVLLYGACSALRIILLKEQLFWETILKDSMPQKYNNQILSSEIEQFKSKVRTNLLKYKESLYNGRISKISSQLIFYTQSGMRHAPVPVAGGMQGSYMIKEYYIKWEDNFESTKKNDPFISSKIFSRRLYKSEDSKSDNREKCVAELSNEMEKHKKDIDTLFNEKIKIPLENIITNISITK